MKGWNKKMIKLHCVQETHFRSKDTHGLKVKGWKNVFCSNNNQKRTVVSTLMSDKIDFKTKIVTRDQKITE